MKNQKNERGITLVALVVTIVVLLILAGITIMYVMSDNGVFGQATSAQQKSDSAAVEEAVSTALVSLYPEIFSGTLGDDGKVDLTKSFKDNLSPSMKTDKATSLSVKAEQSKVNSLKVTGLTVTYKGKDYTVTYNPATVDTGTAGVVASVVGGATNS